jgi:hypothetical protein
MDAKSGWAISNDATSESWKRKLERKEKIDGCICRLCQENWHSYN